MLRDFKDMEDFRKKSPLETNRLKYEPKLPNLLKNPALIEVIQEEKEVLKEDIHSLFPTTCEQGFLRIKRAATPKKEVTPLRVGVIFSGGPASGGHNVIAGLFDGIRKYHPHSTLFGFLGGPAGLIENKKKELSATLIQSFRNMGGFDLIGTGRTKIEKEEQFAKVLKNVRDNALSSLVIIGGDDSNTNAALLAEYLLKNGVKTNVIGVPKTIDGDLKGDRLEISFGFDTATKIYSELIGNIAHDALSAGKYYHFIKLMGRSASHITLECALSTHPNIALIGEEIAKAEKTLSEIVSDIVEVIEKRAKMGKQFGVILIPEGLIEFIPEIRALIKELNNLLTDDEEDVLVKLSHQAKKTLQGLPEKIQKQILLERDAHGNVQLSQIATEELLVEMVKSTLTKSVHYKGKFTAITHFFGYEGRSAFPSPFDATYGYALGHVAAALAHSGYTGYMATLYNLKASVEDWIPGGIPHTSMIHLEERKGKRVAVIKKALVELDKEPFLLFSKYRKHWEMDDDYRYPGPMQFNDNILDSLPFTISTNASECAIS